MPKRPLLMLSLLAAIALLAMAARAQADPAAKVGAAVAPPIRGYVYLEPFEIRQEFVLDLVAVEARLAAPPPGVLGAAERTAVLAGIRTVLSSACDIRADGETLAFEFVDIRFIRIDPKLGPVADERESIPTTEAVVAAVLASPRPAFPRQLEIEWRLFAADGSTTPVEIQVTAKNASYSETLDFSPSRTTRTWDVPAVGKTPRLLAPSKIREHSRTTPTLVAALFLLLGVTVIGLAFRRSTRRRTGFVIAGAFAILLGGVSLYNVVGDSAAARVTEVEARGIVESLLDNIYHAFAYRDESAIFDTLAESVDGPLLEQLYLDIRRGLNVEDSGGPRVRVLNVTLVSCELQRAGGGGLKAGVVWVSEGNVSHWGHEHNRRNQYRGELHIQAVDGRWKVKEVNILDEERT